MLTHTQRKIKKQSEKLQCVNHELVEILFVKSKQECLIPMGRIRMPDGPLFKNTRLE